MRSMSADSSMLAITSSFPPQRQQRAISIANTRFSLCIQVMPVCFVTCRSVSAPRCAPWPRPAGVMAARHPLAAAKTP
jgi:hypothetical protein